MTQYKKKSEEIESETEESIPVFTISTLLPAKDISSWGKLFLDEYTATYNYAIHEILTYWNQGCPNGTKPSEVRAASLHAERIPYRLLNAGAMTYVLGQAGSQKECKKDYVSLCQRKLNRAKREWDKMTEAKSNAFLHPDKTYTPAQKNSLWREGMTGLLTSHEEKQRLESKFREAVTRKRDTRIEICFGGRKLYRERNRIPKDDYEGITNWKHRWDTKRLGSIYFVGSSDEAMGCSNAQITWQTNSLEKQEELKKAILANPKIKRSQRKKAFREAEGQFMLSIAVPTYFQEKYGQRKLDVPLDINMYQEELRQHILLHTTTSKKTIKDQKIKSSLAIRLIRDTDGNYAVRISISTNQAAQGITTNAKNGVLGIDLNNGHLDVVEVDKSGNFLKVLLLEMDLKGKSSKQINTIISQATLKIVEWAKETGKDIVAEDLDFAKKKGELKSGDNTGHNKMLSSLPYAKIRDFLKMQCYRLGVKIKFVDPAYTSLIGELKYATRYGLDRHGSAALVIARRGMGFKEHLPKDAVVFSSQELQEALSASDAEASETFKVTTTIRVSQPRGVIHTSKRLLTQSTPLHFYFKNIKAQVNPEKSRKRNPTPTSRKSRLRVPSETALKGGFSVLVSQKDTTQPLNKAEPVG